MTKKHLLFLLAGILSLSSCAKILTFSEGRRMPHLETDKKIASTINKYHLPQDKMLYYHTDSELNNTLAFFNNTPGIYIADPDGHLCFYVSKKTYCPAPVETYLRNLCISTPEGIDSSVTDNLLEKTLYNRDSTNYIVNKSNKTRIYIGWMVSDHNVLREKLNWDSIITNLKDCDFEIHWVNTDQLAKNEGFKRRKKIKLTEPAWKAMHKANKAYKAKLRAKRAAQQTSTH